MSRSRKKPFVTISKVWDKFKERAYRHHIKHELEKVKQDILFCDNIDPDADFEALSDPTNAEWGTKFGFNVPPKDSDDTWMHEEYERLQRK